MSSLIIVGILSCVLFRNGVLGRYTSIISFGDSLADTGNRLLSEHDFFAKNYPYGETFFQRPTGRCSNGRLIIDFIAQSLGLPFIPPYLGHTSRDFQHGVNFAVSGATALDASFFRERDIEVHTNLSLGVQLGWFRQLLPSLCNSSSACPDKFRNAIFLVGEIGENDYNHPLNQMKNIQEILSFVPKVIAMISSTIRELIHEGVVTFLVPGTLPIGCAPSYLRLYQSQNVKDYDPSTGCLNSLNELAQFHNSFLQYELKRLRELYPKVTIIYADYYGAVKQLYQFPTQQGLRGDVRVACCGGGGPYNYNASAICGSQGSNVCDDPSSYVSWDGNHLTEVAYEWIASSIIEKLFTIPGIFVSSMSSSPGNADLAS